MSNFWKKTILQGSESELNEITDYEIDSDYDNFQDETHAAVHIINKDYGSQLFKKTILARNVLKVFGNIFFHCFDINLRRLNWWHFMVI